METKAGEAMRLLGLRVLGDRYEVLLGRSRRRDLLPSEKREFAETGRAIEQLQAMAPLGHAPLRGAQRWNLPDEQDGEESA